MKVINVRNVAEALPAGISLLLTGGVKQSTRAGTVLVYPMPVSTVYQKPTERVLFSEDRDANPFFHLAESVWMLAGREDAAFLNNYVSDFGKRFAEPDGRIHDAYGNRWRNHFFGDQLNVIIQLLQNNPDDRQAVLAMWDPNADLGVPDLKSRPCNTHVYFRVNNIYDQQMVDQPCLDMLVSCRSNDILWGAYGANAVHFSIMQEYVAQMIGVGVGTYTQMSFNYHMYLETWERFLKAGQVGDPIRLHDNRYISELLLHTPVVKNPTTFGLELNGLMGALDVLHEKDSLVMNPDGVLENFFPESWDNTFLGDVWIAAVCMKFFRLKKLEEAITTAHTIRSSDWRIACMEWLERRRK